MVARTWQLQRKRATMKAGRFRVCWLLWRRGEMSGYQPRSLREEIGMILNRLKLDPAATRCDKATIER